MRQPPLGNALCYSIIKLNKNMNRTKLNKTNKLISMFTYLYIIYAWLLIEEETYKHAERNSIFQAKCQNFCQISVFFNWVPYKKLHRTTAAEHERVTNE